VLEYHVKKENRLCPFCESSPFNCGDDCHQSGVPLKLSTTTGQLKVLQSDKFQCSDPEVLKIYRQEMEFHIPWKIITNISIDKDAGAPKT
jgi:hypothetical protein